MFSIPTAFSKIVFFSDSDQSLLFLHANPGTECSGSQGELAPGQTLFLAVQPKFMNVDIRITIDVTQGRLCLNVESLTDTQRYMNVDIRITIDLRHQDYY